MGCKSGVENEPGGCYGDCYAARTAKRYGHDFSKTTLRDFANNAHRRKIISQINKVKMPFIRIGASGDPSENWEHTIKIIKDISKCNIEIVIITRHWKLLTDDQLKYLSTLNICFNTSVSALDNSELLKRSIEQYNRIKSFCKSILRIVSCSFNLEHPMGFFLSAIQDNLFKNENTLDTVFRPSKKNKFVVDGIVKAKYEVFNGRKQFASKMNKKTYMGKCSNCKEMCGQGMTTNYKYLNKRKIIKQLTFF